MDHFFNGDTSKDLFLASGLAGTWYVWREMLCDGPCIGTPGSSDFFRNRSSFFETSLSVSPEEYTSKTVAEWERFQARDKSTAVTLWFEYDLFCQINLLALLTALKNDGQTEAVYLVCPGKDSHDQWKPLGYYSPEEFPALFQKRKQLTASDFTYAASAWQAFAAKDPTNLLNFIQYLHPTFPYLPEALLAHARRFPHHGSRMNAEEESILQCLKTEPLADEALIRKLLMEHNHPQGFGDGQWSTYLNSMQGLVERSANMWRLTKQGEDVLAGERPKELTLGANRWLGGAKATDFLWLEKEQRFISQSVG